MREVKKRKEGYRRLDEAIRRHQQSRKMVAVTEDVPAKKGRKKDKSGAGIDPLRFCM